MKDLHPKTKDFANLLIRNPKMSQTEAYLATHATTKRLTATTNARQLLAKPSVQIYLKKHEDRAKRVILEVMDNSAKRKNNPQHATIAHKAAESILDRNLGKPVIKTNNLNMNISLEEALNSLE